MASEWQFLGYDSASIITFSKHSTKTSKLKLASVESDKILITTLQVNLNDNYIYAVD